MAGNREENPFTESLRQKLNKYHQSRRHNPREADTFAEKEVNRRRESNEVPSL